MCNGIELELRNRHIEILEARINDLEADNKGLEAAFLEAETERRMYKKGFQHPVFTDKMTFWSMQEARKQLAKLRDLAVNPIHCPETDEMVLEAAHIDSQAAQIEALKEKLITETAYHLYYKCQGDCCRMICSAGSHKEEARQQLAKEMPEVDW